MKKTLTLVMLALIAGTTTGQEPNKRLQRLENYLNESGSYNIVHSQSATQKGTIVHSWNTYFQQMTLEEPLFNEDMSEAEREEIAASYDDINAARRWKSAEMVDSVRLTFAHLAAEASESYCYEYHKGNIDTIKYTWVYRADGDTRLSPSPRFKEWWEIGNARELVNFSYDKGYDSSDKAIVEKASYNHNLVLQSNITPDKMQTFDIEAFETHINPALNAFKKLKGAKAYPVYWRHDEGFEDDVKPNEGLIRREVRYGRPTYGLVTGTHYFIPLSREKEAEALYKQLIDQAYDYVNNHPEQLYTYKFTSRFSMYNLEDVVVGRRYKDNDDDYYISCMRDNDGYHILAITSKGDRWIPRDWQKLKSYINGEKTYRKGLEPKGKKE